MDLQSSGTLSSMPREKTPRKGQQLVFDLLASKRSINAKLPTGYGKTFVIDESYRILKKRNEVDRMLVIFPSTAQITQYKDDNPEAIDISIGRYRTIKHHTKNLSDVYVVTTQSMIKEPTYSLILEILEKCSWFIAIDEYHHYAIDKTWGEKASSLPYTKRLCLSATPYRKYDDSSFGKPDVKMNYREAVIEGAVKPLKGHSYIYVIDFLDNFGNLYSYRTDNFKEELLNTNSPTDNNDGDRIDKAILTRGMRWSPKYVSPLITNPIDRMLSDRNKTGVKLQSIVFCFSVSHAEIVCKQISSLYPDLKVDWIGQGVETGREDVENREIVRRFLCRPPHGSKSFDYDRDGIDILCNYAKAGEGINSINVSEIIFLKNVLMNNTNMQAIGRASRTISDINGNNIEITGNVNFDSTSELSENGYIGSNIMDAIDEILPTEELPDESETSSLESEYNELPDDPKIHIMNVELAEIKSMITKEQLVEHSRFLNYTKVISDELFLEMSKTEAHPRWEDMLDNLAMFRKVQASKSNPEYELGQWQEVVKNAVSAITGLVIRVKYGRNVRVEKSLAGDIKKRIHQYKSAEIGKIEKDIDIYKKHYQWIKDLEMLILNEGLPAWLV